jgi:hypothetical protein
MQKQKKNTYKIFKKKYIYTLKKKKRLVADKITRKLLIYTPQTEGINKFKN